MTVAIAPTPPQAFVSTLPADAPTGSLVTVKASGGDYTSLQAAMNFIVTLNQNLNHVIQIDAGLTLVEAVVTPPKTGTGWVTVRSSEWASLPAGTRVMSGAHMAILASPADVSPTHDQGPPALFVKDGSHGWRFIGLEIQAGVASANHDLMYELVTIGGKEGVDNKWHSPSGPPVASRVSIERCYIHGWQFKPLGHGVILNCQDAQVWDCRIDEVHRGKWNAGMVDTPPVSSFQESPAILMADGRGPFRIENNYCSAAGQCIYFYAKDNSADWNGMSFVDGHGLNVIPGDAIVRRNTLAALLRWKDNDQGERDPSWDGSHWVVKQLIEFKSGRRVLFEGNIMDTLWGGQGQVGQTPGIVAFFAEDIRYQYNLHQNVLAGFYIGGQPSDNDSHSFPASSTRRQRIAILHNLFKVPGKFMQYTSPAGEFDDIWIEHNTQVGGPSDNKAWLYFLTQRFTRCTIRNNVFCSQFLGMNGFDGGDGAETDAQLHFDEVFGTDREFQKNGVFGRPQGNYNPAEFTLFVTAADAGLNADGTLTPGSPLRAGQAVGASDGTDNGVDFAALNAAQLGNPQPPVADFSYAQTPGTLIVQYTDLSA